MTATRQDLIDGLQVVLREGLRVTSAFGPDDWKKPALGGDEEGWTRKQVYSHLTALAEVTPGLVGSLANLEPGQDGAAGLDIDAFNAQTVAAKAAMSEADLMAAYKTGFEKLIEFVKAMPEEQLERSGKFGQLEGKVADVMDGVLVLHGVAHVYGAGGSPLG
ncbi:MAG: maleylpyruvate isomerase N-terminal domain-containing protein [Dehalococcoidia bacterium]